MKHNVASKVLFFLTMALILFSANHLPAYPRLLSFDVKAFFEQVERLTAKGKAKVIASEVNRIVSEAESLHAVGDDAGFYKLIDNIQIPEIRERVLQKLSDEAYENLPDLERFTIDSRPRHLEPNGQLELDLGDNDASSSFNEADEPTTLGIPMDCDLPPLDLPTPLDSQLDALRVTFIPIALPEGAKGITLSIPIAQGLPLTFGIPVTQVPPDALAVSPDYNAYRSASCERLNLKAILDRASDFVSSLRWDSPKRITLNIFLLGTAATAVVLASPKLAAASAILVIIKAFEDPESELNTRQKQDFPVMVGDERTDLRCEFGQGKTLYCYPLSV